MIHEALPWILSIGKYLLASAALLLFYRGLFLKNATYTESRIFLLSITVCAALVSQFRIAVTTPEATIIEVNAESNQLLTANTSLAAKKTAVATEMNMVRQNTAAVPAPIEGNIIDRSAGLNRLITTLEQSIGWILLSIYLLVLLFLGLNLSIQYAGIRKLRRKGEVEFKDTLRLVRHPDISCPFSFGKTIFLPENLKESQLEVILEHESWHIRHKHYVDVLIQEITTCLFWFNPIQWLIRSDLRSIHEFQADRSVLDKGCDLFRYQTIILEEVMGNHIRLANGFNQSFTKKRFIQMKNHEPLKLSAVRKLMLAPLLALLFATFCFVPGQSQVVKVEKKTSKTGTDGKTESTTVTLVDTVKISVANVYSGDQSQKMMDSIAHSAEKVLPLLRKLEKADLSQNPQELDEFLEVMDFKVNNRTITHKDLSKEVLSSLKQKDFQEMELYMKSVQATINKIKRQPQGQANLSQDAMLNLINQFGNLEIVQKLMPDILKLLGSIMSETMESLTQSSTARLGQLAQIETVSINNLTKFGMKAEPEPVPVYINPYCKLSDELFEWSREPFGEVRVVSIEPKSSETVVTLCIPIYLNQWIRFSNKTQLINTKNGDRYSIRRVENMPLNTEIFFHEVDQRMVLAKVVFPPLKSNVKVVDFIEYSDIDGSESEWSFKNIDLSIYKPRAGNNTTGSGAKVYY